MRSFAATLATLVAATVVWPATAGAQAVNLLPSEQRTVSAPSLSSARCDRPAGPLAGVGRTIWLAPARGFVTVTLQSAAGSDWDLGLFEAHGRRLAGSLSPGRARSPAPGSNPGDGSPSRRAAAAGPRSRPA